MILHIMKLVSELMSHPAYVPQLGLPDFQKAKPGHNLFSKKMLIVMLSNFKFVSITYRQNIQNT